MIKNDWSPVPKVFSTIGDVKKYCEAYILNTLVKVDPRLRVDSLNSVAQSNSLTLSEQEFSILCEPVVEQKSVLLLLKQAKGQMLSKVELNYLCYAVPAYVENKILLSIRPDYPLFYARTQIVTYKQPVGNYTNNTINGINYKSKPSEDRIRHFRLEEVYHLFNIIPVLGKANDHRYTELEMVGLILWFYLSNPVKYYVDIITSLIRTAEHGLHLRALLKPYSVSVKRWPDYWSVKLGDTEPYIEVETILGFIIVESITDDMLSDLDEALDITNINYYHSEELLLSDVITIMESWVDVKTRSIKTINIEDYFYSWDLWTTSGSASDVRIAIDGEKKKSRIHKSSLPLFMTVDELFLGRLQPSRTSVKAETSKARLVFSAPTYDSLSAGYLLYKYDTHIQNSNILDFFAMSQTQMLNTSADIIDKLSESKSIGSSDVEHNDWIQNVVFDCYLFVLLIEKVILSEDIPILLDLCSRSLFNWVFIPGIEYRSRHLTFSNKKGTHILSTGGLITGQRRTTLYNGFCNHIGNQLAMQTIKRTLNISAGAPNLFGGDDSIQIFNSHSLGALTFIVATALYLTISPLKSFVSKTSAEYFRVSYSDTKRQGYSNRVIHSIVSSNPVSLQEIDYVLKCKSMYDTLQIFSRRSGSLLIDTLFSIYYERLGLTVDMIRIPTSAGGCGIGQPSNMRLVPGIPRYNSNVYYTPKSSWFTRMVGYLNPFSLQGVESSYIKDMSKGVIDRAKVKSSRDKYKLSIDFWKGKVKFKDNHNDWDSAYKLFTENKQMLTRVEYYTVMSKQISYNLFGAVSSWQKFTNKFVRDSESIRIIDKSNTRIISDVINRSEMEKVSDKISFLKDNNLVDFTMGVINRLPGKVLLDLILGQINGNNTISSVPTDMHFYFSIIRSYQQSKKLSYVAQSILSNLATNSLYSVLKTQYYQLLSW